MAVLQCKIGDIMGGRACKHVKTIRLTAEDYHPFAKVTVNALSTHFVNPFIAIPAFHEKSDFGDLDIMFTGGTLCPNQVADCLQSPCIERNGPVTSYAVPVQTGFFQVDLIRVPEDCYDFAYGYFAYNDLGNLLGRIYHRMGFKFGHLGLRYIIRDESNSSHVLEEITITNNFQAALQFVGYDYKRWLDGFATLEDVFRYAVSIPWANRVIFRLDETNHAARVRDRKRKTYNQFLAWVNDPANMVPEHELVEKSQLRAYFLQKAFYLFPGLKAHVEAAKELCRKKHIAHERFNGTLVTNITGLQGKELGRFMHEFINHVTATGQNKTDWAINCPNVSSEIETFYWSDYIKW